MKRSTVRISIVAACVGLPAFANAGGPVGSLTPIQRVLEVQHESIPGELLIKRRSGVTSGVFSNMLRKNGATAITSMAPKRNSQGAAPIDRWVKITLPRTIDSKTVLRKLKTEPAVESAELNYRVTVALTPNDPRFAELWGLHNIGQSGGTADADIDAPEAWDVVTGNTTPLIAVIDTGVDYTHPDLAANIWTNPGEIASNGIDDDSNGYIDDIHGYDFANDDSDPMDDNGHGTHVSGTIAGVGNNGIGVTGVSWQARIMAVKFLGGDGSGSISDAVDAVLYAAQNHARVLNNSWGGGGHSQALEDAISTANSQNALFVAAAGNSASNNDAVPAYPASYTVPNVVAVAAVDHNDNLASFSNYGATSVHLGAPGVAVLSTVPFFLDESGYASFNGTSMAAPHVAGAAALALAQDGTLSALGLKALLVGAVDPTPAMLGKVISNGRLNIANALNCSSTTLDMIVGSPSSNFTAFLHEPTVLSAVVHQCGAPVTDANVTANLSNGEGSFTLLDDGNHNDGGANDGTYGAQWTPQSTGSVTIDFLAAHTSLGSDSATVSGVVRDHINYAYTHVPFRWIDESRGTQIPLSDDEAVTVPLGFNFDYYGVTYDQLSISSNGLVSFGAPSTLYYPSPIPTTSEPNGFIAPMWSDLNPALGGKVVTKTNGIAPRRAFTVSWVNVPFYGGESSDTVTFQVTLFEGRKEIEVQYLDVDTLDRGRTRGASATVGMEDDLGLTGTQYSYLSPTLRSGTGLRYFPNSNRNTNPVARVGQDYIEGDRLTAIQFDGSLSWDPQGDSLTYHWNFGDGSTATGIAPLHHYAAIGSYTVTLVVNDGQLNSAPASAEVTIVNLAPTANAGADFSVRRSPTPVTLNGSASSDPEGRLVGYQWRQTAGFPVRLSSRPSQSNASFVIPQTISPLPATLEFELTVTDNHGATSTDNVTVTVTP